MYNYKMQKYDFFNVIQQIILQFTYKNWLMAIWAYVTDQVKSKK